MGILPFSLSFHTNKKSEANSNQLQSEPTSLSSQPSLPSVISLTSQTSQQQQPSSTNHQCTSTLKGHSSSVFCLALSEKVLFTGSSDKEIRIWSTNFSSNLQTIHGNSTNNIVAIGGSGAVKSLVVSDDKLFTAHHDHKIRVWKINNENGASQNRKYTNLATLPTLTDRFMRLLPLKNYVQVRRNKKSTWVHHVDAISALALSTDGSLLYSASWDRTFKIWRTSDFKCLESISNAHDDAINAIALSNNGYLYTGSADKKINVWRKEPGEKKHSLVFSLEKHRSAVNALTLSSDGLTLYSGACDRSIVVWEKDNNGNSSDHMVVMGALRGHTRAILCLVVVSELICSGSADKTVRIWRRGLDKSYSCLAVLEGHKGPVKCLTAAIDHYNSTSSGSTSYQVYSGSLDCDIRVWQILVPFL